MEMLKLPVGTGNFTEIRESGNYYVDKTHVIGQIVRDNGKIILFTRPRRFGKTTLQTMLEAFFDIRKSNTSLFTGLSIMNDKETVESWMNCYPVIFLSFKDVDGLNYENALSILKGIVQDLFSEYRFLLEDDIVEADASFLSRMLSGEITDLDIRRSLSVIVRLISAHYHKGVIIIVDEYDVPLAKAEANGYYSQMIDVMHSMLSILKDNPNVKKAILTGCLRISKESLFTGLNNMTVYSLTGAKYSDAFGFTENEVSRLLAYYNVSNKASDIKRWYDGYNIAGESIYAPWDMLSYINDLMSDKNALPDNYWANTSGNTIIRKFINHADINIYDDYSTLINGGYIAKIISEDLTYKDMYSNDNNIWSLMLSTGYLTLADKYRPNEEICLKLPNEEIRQLFIRAVNSWFQERMRSENLSELFNAIWNGDTKKIGSILSDYLERAISYYDYSESFYHAFVTGLFSATKYRGVSNRERGNGRSGLLIIDINNKRVAVFEFKIAKTENSIEKKLHEGILQIEDKKYASDFSRYRIFKYCVTFYKKGAYCISTSD